MGAGRGAPLCDYEGLDRNIGGACLEGCYQFDGVSHIMTALGPNFRCELETAGLLGLPFVWGADGTFSGLENLTEGQSATLAAVVAAHNPATKTAKENRDLAFMSDADRLDLVTRLKTATPNQIKNYVDSNVTDLASAKVLLMKMLLALAFLSR